MLPSDRQRLRYEGLDFEVEPDGSCSVEVRLEWRGSVHVGEARGMQPLEGELRTAAHATLEAALSASGGGLELTLIGVKTVRAFDALLVVAAVRAEAGGGRYKLIGAKAAEREEQPVETAARAVLDALNRVLERYVDKSRSARLRERDA